MSSVGLAFGARALKLLSFDSMLHAQESCGAYSSPLQGICPYWHEPRTKLLTV